MYSWNPVTPRELASIRPGNGLELPIHLKSVRPLPGPSGWKPSTPGVSLAESTRTGPRITGGTRNGYPPGAWRSSVRTTAGETVFDVEVKIDQLGYRETPNPSPERRTRYLMNLGCSFTFEEGLAQSDTFSARLARNAPKYHVYNHGKAGAGPFESLEALRNMKPAEELAETDGIGTYLYMSDHVRRITPSISYDMIYRTVPFFEFDGHEVRRYPTYVDAHPFLAFIYHLLSSSSTLGYYGINVPRGFGFQELRNTAWILRALNDSYVAKMGNDRFYVILYPEGRQTVLPELLKEAGVKFLNYQPFDIGRYVKGSPVLHPLDSHPSAEAVDLLAREVATDLGL
jgi:hypothetical protein